MDILACTVCGRLCTVSLVFTIFIALLVSSPMRVSSEVLKEQHCRARPTVVPVEKSGYKPHHIELHRCSGTCNDAPPTHRPCKASSMQEITLDLTDLTSNKANTVTVYNHTQCACDCELTCKLDEGELPDEENCKCVILPKDDRFGRENERTADVLPYQIGIAVVGFFALCVLVVDMIMCGKDKGVLYKVKEKCCKSDKLDNRDMSLQNGKHSSTKDSSSHAVEAV